MRQCSSAKADVVRKGFERYNNQFNPSWPCDLICFLDDPALTGELWDNLRGLLAKNPTPLPADTAGCAGNYYYDDSKFWKELLTDTWSHVKEKYDALRWLVVEGAHRRLVAKEKKCEYIYTTARNVRMSITEMVRTTQHTK